MRCFGWHCNKTSLSTGVISQHPTEVADKPSLTISLEFKLRNGNLSPPMQLLGLVDTGASLTIVPGFWLGLSIPTSAKLNTDEIAKAASVDSLAAKMDFEPVFVTGVLGEGYIPGYRAYASIGGHRLKEEILVGAIVDRYEPLIGRDVLAQGILTVDPWQTTSAIAVRKSGRLAFLHLGAVQGALRSPVK